MEPLELEHVEAKLSDLTTPIEEQGTPPLDSKQGGWITFPFIIGSLTGFSLASSGWLINLIVFLITELNVKSIHATQISNVVFGCINLFPIAGAILADSFLGSFSVITISSFVSQLGVIMLTLIATIHSLRPPSCANKSITCESPTELQYAVLYASLSVASIGVGGLSFNMAAMGANQFDKTTDQAIYFNWYYVTWYSMYLVSATAIVYVEDNVSWGLGFGICIIANAMGISIFLLGKHFYKKFKPKGSPFTSMARVVVAAIRKRNMSGSNYHHGTNETSKVLRTNVPTKSFRCLNSAALKTDDDAQSDGSYAKSWRLCTVEEVEDLKTLIKIIPLWSTGIFLSAPIAMLSNLIILQALTMDRHFGPHFKIPPASFSVFNLLATAISILLIDRLLIPMWQNLTRWPLTLLQRVGIGHIINIVAMVASALIEAKRLHVARVHHLVDQPGSVVPMSALWLVVPLVIAGLGEAFQFPGQVALYYQEFPIVLKSTSTAMISLLIGIGFYLSTAITDLVRHTTNWLPDNINEGRVDNVFWMLAVIGAVNFGYYLACAKLFKYQNVTRA